MSYLLNHQGPVNHARLSLRHGESAEKVLMRLLDELLEEEKQEVIRKEELEEELGNFVE